MIEWFERSSSAITSSRGARRARHRRAARGTATAAARMPRRQHAVEILERRALQLLVVGLQAAKRNLQRLARQHQRQQREHVREALARAVAHELVERRLRSASKPSSSRRLSHTGRPTASFAQHDLEDPLAVDLDPRILLEDRRRATAPTGTGRRSADRRGRASGRRPRAARRTPRTRAPAGGGRRSPDSDRCSASTSCPTCSSATFRSANIA